MLAAVPTATATETAVPPTATPTPQPAGPTANRNANLRAGPGTEYAVVSTAATGDRLTVVGENNAGDWVQVASGAWIARFLVDNAPTALAVVAAPTLALPPTPTISPAPTIAPAPTIFIVQPTTAPPLPVAPPAPTANSGGTGGSGEAFICNGGCAEPPPGSSCTIKGNVNSKKEKIYHTTSSRSYTQTDIKPEEGDRWFCTTAEAEAAGFRAPNN